VQPRLTLRVVIEVGLDTTEPLKVVVALDGDHYEPLERDGGERLQLVWGQAIDVEGRHLIVGAV
jgi:hypothetical protein